MTTLEEAVAKELCYVMLQEKVDIYGNKIESPIYKVLNNIIKEKEKYLIDLVLSNLTDEKIAEKIAKNLNDRYSWESKQLSAEIKNKIVQILAEKELNKLEKLST